MLIRRLPIVLQNPTGTRSLRKREEKRELEPRNKGLLAHPEVEA